MKRALEREQELGQARASPSDPSIPSVPLVQDETRSRRLLMGLAILMLEVQRLPMEPAVLVLDPEIPESGQNPQ